MSKEHYEVLETIGTGSFGTVCKLRRKADGKILVWKDINFGKMSEKEKTQLVAEVNILRELRNPFIVRYHDRIVDKPSTRLYIIMEYCAGGDLGRIIKKCKRDRTNLDEQLIWKVFAQAIVALKDCHRRVENGENKPIIHRDLKPANILLDSSQNIKIGDFGLAKELSSQSKLAQTNVGTPYYMAPEIINEKDYDERSDIWSLGCLLYELAALKPPFDASNAVSLAVKINAGKFSRIPSKYSDGLFDAIKMMLQTEPKRRPRVGDIEQLPALQAALSAARSLASDFQMQQTYASKWRELKAREDAAAAKEEELRRREEAVVQAEAALMAREKELHQLSDELQAQRRHQQQQQQHQGAKPKRGSWSDGSMVVADAAAARRMSTEPMSLSDCGDDEEDADEAPGRQQDRGGGGADSVPVLGGDFHIHVDRPPQQPVVVAGGTIKTITGAGGSGLGQDQMPTAVRRAKDTLLGAKNAGGAGGAGGGGTSSSSSNMLAMRAAPSVPSFHRVNSVTQQSQQSLQPSQQQQQQQQQGSNVFTRPQKLFNRAARGSIVATGAENAKENVPLSIEVDLTRKGSKAAASDRLNDPYSQFGLNAGGPASRQHQQHQHQHQQAPTLAFGDEALGSPWKKAKQNVGSMFDLGAAAGGPSGQHGPIPIPVTTTGGGGGGTTVHSVNLHALLGDPQDRMGAATAYSFDPKHHM